MPFTPFVLRVLLVNGHCKVSIGVFFINSNCVLSSLNLDFPNSVTGSGYVGANFSMVSTCLAFFSQSVKVVRCHMHSSIARQLHF